MKSYLVKTDGGIDDIESIEQPEPICRRGYVKIRMRAASLNYRDLGVAAGGYLRNDTRPVVPLSDGAGEIVEVGDGVTLWKVGDRVSPIFVQKWIDGAVTDAMLRTSLGGGIDGVLTEFMVVPENSIVAIYALQLAKSAGARVIITSSSDKKLELAKSLGADQTINYQTHPDWHREVKTLTEGVGVDHVVEVGGPGTLEKSIKST